MSRNTLHQHLEAQLAARGDALPHRGCIRKLIQCIDEYGYLQESLEEIGRAPGCTHTQQELEDALKVLQTFRPRGVGAFYLSECLLLQIDQALPDADLLRAIVQHHLLDANAGSWSDIARRRGVSVDRVEKMIRELKRLDPRPGLRYR